MPYKNPLALSEVVVKDKLNSSLIIQAYARDYDIDVSDYFESVTSVEIMECRQTGYRFYFPFNLVGRDDIYEKLQDKTGYYHLRLEHKLAEAFIKDEDLVLEVGCGNGFFLKQLSQRKIISIGLEFNTRAVDYAKNQGLNVFKSDILGHSQDFRETYDVVCCFQVLEHIVEVRSFIQACLDCLKPGGKFIIGVPNNNPYLYKYDKYHTLNLPPHHMGLWNEKSLRSLQNIFNIQLEKLIIPPLSLAEYEYVLKVRNDHVSLPTRIADEILLNLKPVRLRAKVHGIANKFEQGRNILATYTKTTD